MLSNDTNSSETTSCSKNAGALKPSGICVVGVSAMSAKILNNVLERYEVYQFTICLLFLFFWTSSIAQVEKVSYHNQSEFRLVYERLVDDTTVKHGTYIAYLKQVKIIEGEFSNNQMVGNWSFYYPLSGTLKSKGTYTDGHQSGAWEYYYTNGELKALKEYHRLGPYQWESFYKNKKKYSSWVFENDLLNHAFALSKEGDTTMIKSFAYGRAIEGTVKTYYDGGFRSAQYNYKLANQSAIVKEQLMNKHPLYIALLLNNGLDQNRGFSINGSFRAFNRKGYLSEHFIFDDGKLLQMLDMTSEFGTQLNKGDFEEGNGQVIQYNSKNIPVRRSNYSNGLLNGKYEVLETVSKKAHTTTVGEYKNGKPSGTWKKLDAFFKPEYELNCTSDSTIEYIGWNKGGGIEQKGNYTHLRKDGEWVVFDIYKDTLFVTNYHQGVRHGTYKSYLLGHLLQHGQFKNGVKDGIWTSFNMSGQPTFSEQFNAIGSIDGWYTSEIDFPSPISAPVGSIEVSSGPVKMLNTSIEYFTFEGRRFEVRVVVDANFPGDANYRLTYDDNGFVRSVTHLASNHLIFMSYAQQFLSFLPILEPQTIGGIPIGNSCNISFYFVPL